MQKAREIVSPQEEQTMCFPVQMVSPESMHAGNIIQTEKGAFMYMHMCVTYLMKKRSHGFERESKEGVHGRVWREKEEGGNVVVIL